MSAYLSFLSSSPENVELKESAYDYEAKDIDGKDVPLSKYKGKVTLITNVASECGFTPQYKELEQVYQKYKNDGFEVLGFPCNQFGGQEPGDVCEIKKFSEARSTFDMFDKIDVNGQSEHPLYTFLKAKQGGWLTDGIKWNFTKFLVDQNGVPVQRYSPSTKPSEIEADITALLSSSK